MVNIHDVILALMNETIFALCKDFQFNTPSSLGAVFFLVNETMVISLGFALNFWFVL